MKWVHSATAGVERVLTPTALERGLAITNARGVFSDPIAEYVVMWVLAVSRRLPQLLELQRERTWQPLEGREMTDVTIGIVGYGLDRTPRGRAGADIRQPRGRHAAQHGRRRRAGRSRSALVGSAARADGRSDFIVLALPLTAGTTDLFDAQLLAHAKPGAWLINVARGALVDERALVRAARNGPLGGAILDAFREEPLPADSELYATPNVIVTPHTSWSSGRVLDRSIELFCDNLGRFARGEPLLNLVDSGAGY